LAPRIQTTLDALRARIRQYVWGHGVTTALAWLGLAFWLSLALDWFFEPPVAFRVVLFALVAVVFLGVLARLVLGRLLVPLRDSSMATVLERRFPQLDDALLTTVVLSGRDLDPEKCNPQMLSHTCHDAEERIGGVRLGDVFNPAPLRRSAGGALLLAGSIAVFGLLLPEEMGTWFNRNLLFSADLWPRQSRLEIGAPFVDGVAKVARGADLTVVVRAATDAPRVPQTVQIRYRSEGGAWNTKNMDREGVANPAVEPYQQFSYVFKDILAPIRFDVRDPGPSGDRLQGLRIEVVDSPAIAEMKLICKFPDYADRPARTVPVTGVMQVALGSEITVLAKANKELVGVKVDSSRGEQTGPAEVIGPEQLAADHRGFSYVVPALEGDTTLLFTLSDVDGIRSREPVRLVLAATLDEPPQVRVRLDGIGTAVTPNARLPLVGQVSDDYGIARLWAELTVDQGEPAERELVKLAKHPPVYDLADVGLEVADLGLTPGQKLLLSAKASDRFDLGGKGPNVGTSERWLLDVVTPEQLQAMLESRELVLRQRFEVILNEVTETRDLLLKITFHPADEKQPDDKRAAEPEDAAAKDGAKEKEKKEKKEKPADAPAGAEPGDAPKGEGKELTPEKHLELQTMRVQRALQNARKNAHEVAGVAESFDDIRKQLVNNRIDTEELKLRIEDRIAKPLHRIADEMFPELQQRIEQLQENLGDAERGPPRRERARKQADDVLARMQLILSHMLELEDFNEAVELLRQIIKLQDQLDEQTKQRHKEKIRELKED
jgi:hypothetical protein